MSNEPAGTPPIATFNMRPYWQMLAIVAIFAVWPMVVVYIAAVIADLNGCTISDAGPTLCMVMEADRGGLLYDMAGMVEVSYVVLPLGVALGFVWLCVLIISVMTWRRKRSGVPDATRITVNFGYYALSLLAILAVGYATLASWLPGPVLLLVCFVAIFWIASFLFALATTLRDKVRAK
ncbi:MAG: hypothetical protein ABI398_12465 [Devosia sp.]